MTKFQSTFLTLVAAFFFLTAGTKEVCAHKPHNHGERLLGSMMKELNLDFKTASNTAQKGAIDPKSVKEVELFVAIARTKTIPILIDHILTNLLVEDVAPPMPDDISAEDKLSHLKSFKSRLVRLKKKFAKLRELLEEQFEIRDHSKRDYEAANAYVEEIKRFRDQSHQIFDPEHDHGGGPGGSGKEGPRR